MNQTMYNELEIKEESFDPSELTDEYFGPKWWTEIDEDGCIQLPEKILCEDDFAIGTRIMITLGYTENDDRCIFIEKANSVNNVKKYFEKLSEMLNIIDNCSNRQVDDVYDVLYEAVECVKSIMKEE